MKNILLVIIVSVCLSCHHNDYIREKEALIVLYNTTNGDNWKNNTNWCSDQPLKTWHGIKTNDEGFVSELYLNSNQLSGTIPDEIGHLVHLTSLWLFSNRLSGHIPQGIGQLTHLE